MSDPLLRELDHYVVLEPAGREQILTAQDTLAWLVGHLGSLDQVPADLAVLATHQQRAQKPPVSLSWSQGGPFSGLPCASSPQGAMPKAAPKALPSSGIG